MRHLGLFTHKIYSQEEYDIFVIRECTIVLPECCRTERDIQEILRIEANKCGQCYGCPNAKEERERLGETESRQT